MKIVSERSPRLGRLAAIQPFDQHGVLGTVYAELRQMLPGWTLRIRELNRKSLRSLAREALGERDDRYPEADQNHLDRARTRVGASVQPGDEPRDGDVEEAGGREGERVGQHPECASKSPPRRDRADHRGEPGREIELERPAPRQAGLHQDGEVPHAVRDLVRRDRQR